MTGWRGGTFDTHKNIGAPKLNRGLFSSASDEWETPQEFFDAVDAVFHFTLNVCATHANAKCRHYYTKEDDGLSRSWRGI
jgi:site-specific DNA-methyltransferase (adenine-specific)